MAGSPWSSLILCCFSFRAFQATTNPLKPGAFNLLIFHALLVGTVCGNSENLLLFDVDKSLYSERWTGYLIGNFLKIVWKLEGLDTTSITAIEFRRFNLIFYNCHWKLRV